MSNLPGVRPAIPHFSSGPCAKRPGWNLQALTDAVLGRSHRSKIGKAKLKRAIGALDAGDVLMVTAKHLPQVPEHVKDTSHGKRSCFLDFSNPADVAALKKLAREADVFSQGYRPGIMDGHGLSPEALAKERPGIIYLSISCYGAGGPFSGRGGWEQIAQCATGICMENGDERPKLAAAAAAAAPAAVGRGRERGLDQARTSAVTRQRTNRACVYRSALCRPELVTPAAYRGQGRGGVHRGA